MSNCHDIQDFGGTSRKQLYEVMFLISVFIHWFGLICRMFALTRNRISQTPIPNLTFCHCCDASVKLICLF